MQEQAQELLKSGCGESLICSAIESLIKVMLADGRRTISRGAVRFQDSPMGLRSPRGLETA